MKIVSGGKILIQILSVFIKSKVTVLLTEKSSYAKSKILIYWGGVFTESAPRFYLPHTKRDLVLPVCGIFFIWDKLREVDNVEQHWLTYISV